MKILAIADIRGDEPFGIDIPSMGIDLVVSLGDIPPDFLELVLLRKGPVPYVGVNGNEDDRAVPSYADIHGKARQVAGIRVGGFEGSVKHRVKGRHYYPQWRVRWRMRRFPPVDVFIAHSPIAGVHDDRDRVHEGFEGFRDYVERARPKLFLHGHVGKNEESEVGDTRVISVLGKRIIEVEV